MEIFELILLMLSAVFISNVISRFIPSIAVPLIQVALGIILAIPLGDHSMDLNPELFLLLFMAPLLFNDGANVDKKALWRQRKSIISLSLGLVFLTVGVLGMFIHYLLPTIPYAAAFALAAALAPTDAVAVSALAEKVQMPHKVMHTLEGESLINDASGLVSFQFAVLALVTGTFSLMTASTTFVLLSVGGVLLGAILSSLKIMFMRLLRQLGIENETSFMLMEILLPFLIFMVAEAVGVNGILAVVSGGLVHSMSYKRMNPETAQLNTLSKNTWSVITFSLNGLVFVLLGTQLPSILQKIWANHDLDKGMLFVYIIAITGLLLSIRFLWLLFFRNFESEIISSWKERLKSTFLYTISGVRGTITLVSALSLPLVLGNGNTFIERDLLIFLASGVIITTLLLANFSLPLFAPRKIKAEKNTNNDVEIDMLRTIIKELKRYQTEANKAAISKVIKIYNERIFALSDSEELFESGKKLRIKAIEWQLENTKKLVLEKDIDVRVAVPVFKRLYKKYFAMTRQKKRHKDLFYRQIWRKRIRSLRLRPLSGEERRQQRALLQDENNRFVVKQVKELQDPQFSEEVKDLFILRFERRDPNVSNESTTGSVQDLMDFATQMERELIQTNFETGKLTRKEMKSYRDNLLAIENAIQFVE
ncbi:cation:proton antiporter [Brochothrix thermosphacta]|uniref:cation:proton antiporter n=1 Tax=Brochothrix thermosphacta TaxID=2756 RepID=UPI0003E85039|nr:sodium:proton antiporter [Brochothrix thermosphacta]EUJ34495.1 sodium/hydrogen exchanger family protein [Brochothrix thermosphacta DSM 20171 = FSL F6-1036]ODJ51161.1 sodium:proton antiporter [Brochothrix thermosphacta DSM 20171 = FSL F6-1036]ODJ59340.1 sodium:proton antiporter [Brochothrix thermosphacta]ODJ67459.1 sodium:proton antiporter [Brochothrix thermosphacta]WKK69270.1 sodium:proton antiporter [Brochothrix thermosphacta]